METCEPDVAVSLLRLPAMKTYTALKKKLKASGTDWMQGFLEAGGLEVSAEPLFFFFFFFFAASVEIVLIKVSVRTPRDLLIFYFMQILTNRN